MAGEIPPDEVVPPVPSRRKTAVPKARPQRVATTASRVFVCSRCSSSARFVSSMCDTGSSETFQGNPEGAGTVNSLAVRRPSG
jgi:hypothetical protein